MRTGDGATTLGAFLLLIPVLSACGGSGAEPAGQAGPAGGEQTSGGEQEVPSIAELPWAQRTPQQKAQYMNEVVAPTMKALFQEFEPQEFARFGCPTCHGENAREVEFRMPNRLPPLNPAAMPRADSPDANQARWATFMMERVSPKMAELLGQEPYDPATGQGFGCFNCHPRQP